MTKRSGMAAYAVSALSSLNLGPVLLWHPDGYPQGPIPHLSRCLPHCLLHDTLDTQYAGSMAAVPVSSSWSLLSLLSWACQHYTHSLANTTQKWAERSSRSKSALFVGFKTMFQKPKDEGKGIMSMLYTVNLQCTTCKQFALESLCLTANLLAG